MQGEGDLLLQPAGGLKQGDMYRKLPEMVDHCL